MIYSKVLSIYSITFVWAFLETAIFMLQFLVICRRAYFYLF